MDGYSRAWSRVSVLFLLLVGPASFLMGGSGLFQGETDIPVYFDFRSLQPGEVIKVFVRVSPDIRQVSVRFMGKTYQMGPTLSGGEMLTFIGLDLDLEPGIYPLDVFIDLRNGRGWMTRRMAEVTAREFPLRRLWVDERFVTPPPDVRERIGRESELLETIFGIRSDTWLGEAEFVIPLEGEAARNFGQRRIFNNQPRSPHAGEDISAPTGTPVRASNSGRVILANNLYYAGNTVIIDHGLGVTTFYSHLSRIDVRRGDEVGKGTVIGAVGATGRVTGSHLHWAVRICGSRVDPWALPGLGSRTDD